MWMWWREVCGRGRLTIQLKFKGRAATTTTGAAKGGGSGKEERMRRKRPLYKNATW
jgi:hypothetical protein